jgi:uncharacterized LabA/DUF88 family protein
MKRVAFFLDGENIRHAIRGAWLDFPKLARTLTDEADRVVAIYYFTTGGCSQHEAYLRGLGARGVTVVVGRMGKRSSTCRFCRRAYETRVEKQTDVALAVKLLEAAIDDIYDVAVIISADTDFVPAIQAVKARFPHKRVGVVSPVREFPKRLNQVVDFHRKVPGNQLQRWQFAPT